MKISRVVSELFYPSGIKCVICGDDLPKETRYCVCDNCELSFNNKFCLTCGRALKNMADYCDECQHRSYYFDKARAPFVYENEIVGLVHRLKYGGAKYLGEVIAEFMADVYFEKAFGEDFKADFITFVPMPAHRRKSSGYNQAEVIARTLGKIAELPVIDALERVKKTKNLARMGRAERAKTIADAFGLTEGVTVKGKNILLIDDVFTTGATTNECAKVLKSNKADSVMILTFATARIKPDLY